jgi:cyclophilin family peptidyl-prolyl cis-trans isomerase
MKNVFKILCISAISLFTMHSTAQVKKVISNKKVNTIPKNKVVVGKPLPIKVKPLADGYNQVVIKNDKSIKIKITTDSGIILIRLYDSTPLHRDNFVKLVESKFYDSLIFHRVIKNFMIQGGDPQSKTAQPGQMLGNGGGDMERIPAEFNRSLIHKKGTLCAARDGNPAKASSACQFYLVQGNVLTDQDLDGLEMRLGYKYTPAQRLAYKTYGGTPFLDQDYTVFGEVISGLKVIDKIASVQIAPGDRPVADVRMKMEVVKKK